jgi:hypothetical protein
MNSDIEISSPRFTALPSLRDHSGNLRVVKANPNPFHSEPTHPLSRQMAVVNLEARLAVWKSFQNKDLLEASESYRSTLASSLRLSPSFTGSMPTGLIRHGLGFDLDE